MTEKVKGHWVALVTNIFFGLNIPISKSLLASVGPFGWSFSRAIFACLCFWITSLFTKHERLQKSDFGLLLVCALFGMVFNQLSFIVGLTLTSPIDASIISTAVPVMVMIIAAIVLKEPITTTKVTGVLVGATGAVLLITSGSNGSVGSSNNLHGDLLCMLSGLSYAIYLVISKPLVQRYSSVTVMKWTFLFSSVFLFPTGYSELKVIDWANVDIELWLKIAYALFFGTFIPYLLIPMGLKRLRPTTMSMYNYVQPLVATIVAIIALQDTFTWIKFGAAVLVFSGVYIVNRSKSRAQVEAEKQKNENQLAR